MSIKNNTTQSFVLVPFSFSCKFNKLKKRLAKNRAWKQERCKATFLNDNVRNMLSDGSTAAYYVADRSALGQYGITKNAGTIYYTAEDRNSSSFRIGDFRLYIFDSGVGVFSYEICDCEDVKVIHRMRRPAADHYNVYLAKKGGFEKVNILESIRNAMSGLLGFKDINTFFSSGGNISAAPVFSRTKTEDTIDEATARELLVDGITGSGTRDAEIANFNEANYMHPYPGAYWYISPNGVSCVLALAESASVNNMVPRMASDYMPATVLALHKKLTTDKLTADCRGGTIPADVKAKLDEFIQTRTFSEITDESHKYCQKLYEMASSVFAPDVSTLTVTTGGTARKASVYVALVAFIATLFELITQFYESAQMLEELTSLSKKASIITVGSLYGLLLIAEVIVFLVGVLGKDKE